MQRLPAWHPEEPSLDERQGRAVTQLRERYQSIDPFRSIVYSEEGARPLSTVQVPLRPPHAPPRVAAG